MPAHIREMFKWFGTALFFIGSAAVSIFPALSLEWWPYGLFAAGHLLWTTAGVLMRDRAVIALNVMYLPFDLFAVFARL